MKEKNLVMIALKEIKEKLEVWFNDIELTNKDDDFCVWNEIHSLRNILRLMAHLDEEIPVREKRSE